MDPFFKGDTKKYTLSFRANYPGRPSVPIDITGNEIWVTLKVIPGQPDAKAPIQKMVTVPAGAPATNGILEVTLTSEETAKLSGDVDYFFEVQRVIPSGIPSVPPEVSTVFLDTVFVMQDATHKVSSA